MSKITKALLAAVIAAAGLVGSAQAHLIGFGWNDNGNGTVTVFGEHWHGALGSPYSDNGGVTIDGTLYMWDSVLNGSDRNVMLGNGDLDGYQSTDSDTTNYGNWLVTAPLVMGNGWHTMFTGYNCCVDEMDSGPVTFYVTGITSVPEPASLALLGLGLAGVAASRKRKSA